jgi:ribosome-associated protein
LTELDAKTLAATVAALADRKKGEEIRVYDVQEHLRIADWFVVISGLSRPHVRAIHDELHLRLKALGRTHAPAEGIELGWWVLLDYGDVVVHVMQPEARDYYALDELYRECPELAWRSVELPSELAEPRAQGAEG